MLFGVGSAVVDAPDFVPVVLDGEGVGSGLPRVARVERGGMVGVVVVMLETVTVGGGVVVVMTMREGEKDGSGGLLDTG